MKRRILFVHGNSDTIAGQELSLIIRIKILEKCNFSCFVLVHGEGSFTDLLKKNKIEVIPGKLCRLGGWNPLPYLVTVKNILHLIKRLKIDIVHTSGVFPAQYCIPSSRLARIPCVVHINNTVYSKDDLRKSFVQYADAIITVGDRVKKHILENIKYPSEKISVVYNPISYDLDSYRYFRWDSSQLRKQYSIPDQCLLVGQVGLITPRKGLEVFVQAAALVKKDLNSVKFLIIGDVPPGENGYRLKIEKLIDELGLSNDFVFTGFQADILKYISLLDILVNCSTAEGGPRVVAEAMALAKPVVSTDVGFVPEVITSGITGFIFEMNDFSSLAKIIIDLLSNPAKRLAMGAEAKKKFFSQFDPEISGRKLVNIYENL